ncbi:hypothetical protein BCD67_24720 [Oscillatoriales cyanobacterium USR001]|nr:hypothetical protein BCD67_24720 [Oscillatoriales cyanobacterium USR001]
MATTPTGLPTIAEEALLKLIQFLQDTQTTQNAARPDNPVTLITEFTTDHEAEVTTVSLSIPVNVIPGAHGAEIFAQEVLA